MLYNKYSTLGTSTLKKLWKCRWICLEKESLYSIKAFSSSRRETNLDLLNLELLLDSHRMNKLNSSRKFNSFRLSRPNLEILNNKPITKSIFMLLILFLDLLLLWTHKFNKISTNLSLLSVIKWLECLSLLNKELYKFKTTEILTSTSL